MDEIELANDYAVVELPVNAVEVELIVKVYIDGEIRKVTRTMNMDEVRKAFDEAKYYFSDDDLFVLTDKGRAMLNERQKRKAE